MKTIIKAYEVTKEGVDPKGRSWKKINLIDAYDKKYPVFSSVLEKDQELIKLLKEKKEVEVEMTTKNDPKWGLTVMSIHLVKNPVAFDIERLQALEQRVKNLEQWRAFTDSK